MRILGIDCGTERTGYGVIETDGRAHSLLSAGVVKTKTSDPLEMRLALIAKQLRTVLDSYQPEVVAVEEVFYSVNAKSALKLAHVRGVALLIAAEAGLVVSEYSPLEIKMSVVGYGRAEKAQVQMMVAVAARSSAGVRVVRRHRRARRRDLSRLSSQTRLDERTLGCSMLVRIVTLLAVAFCASAATTKLIFTKSFPGSKPALVLLSVDRSGAIEYREQKDDPPTKAALPDADAASLFALAGRLDYFKSPIESGLHVANTGKKTFRYEDEAGVATEVVFNYSINEAAQTLLNRFEQIAATERAFLDLDSAAHFDPLGVNDALAEVESLWLRKELIAPTQFLPLLRRLATHEAYMHLVRARAARLKDEFTGVVADASRD